jgi:beta-galactosidase/beta-glucuronidase
MEAVRERPVSSGTANHKTRTPVAVLRQTIWWPTNVYSGVLALHRGEIDWMAVPFAIRQSGWEQKDRDGKSFIVEVNGKRIFCKGAD